MKKGIFCILALCLFSLDAMSNCPDLSGVYSYTPENKPPIVLNVKTTVVNGKTIYNFERSNVGGKPWIWESIADGKSYPKQMNADHTDVEEIAFCNDSQLFRKLTGDWINGDDLVPFILESKMSNPTADIFYWHTDFSGYGIQHLITEERYQRK